jgi:hypothetical protein
MLVRRSKDRRGKTGLQGYWRDRLVNMRARDIADRQPNGVGVTLSYTTEGGVVRAVLDLLKLHYRHVILRVRLETLLSRAGNDAAAR